MHNALAAQYKVLPLFQGDAITVCPSKSRKIVAEAAGWLLSFGKLNALNVMNNENNNNFK